MMADGAKVLLDEFFNAKLQKGGPWRQKVGLRALAAKAGKR